MVGPAAGGGIGHPHEEIAGGRVEHGDLVAQPAGRRHHLAVHVDLALGPRPVAHPDRRAVPPAGQVGQLPLGQVPLAAHPEHDLQVSAPDQRRRGGRAEIVEESFRLVRAGRHPQRVHGQRGVPDPGIAVVPVTVAADRLRERGRRSGDDRAGGVEGQGLQHPAAVVHEIGPGPGVTLMQSRPRTPRGHRVSQPAAQLVRGPHPRALLAEAAVVQAEGDPLTAGDRPPAERGAPPDLQVNRGGQHRQVGPAPSGDSARDPAQQREDQPVLGPRDILDLQLNLPGDAAELADQQGGRAEAEIVPPLAGAQRQRVGQGDRAGGGGEGGLEHHGLVEVAPGDLELPGRADRPVPRLVVQQPPEDRRAVKSGEAQPLHRPRPVHQRR